MFEIRFTLNSLAAVILAVNCMLVSPTTSMAEEEQPLIDLLQSDAPKAQKAITCKKLAVWGTAKAVPSLAALLPDPELTSWARIALEAIPDPAVDNALRQALEQVEGRALVGVINSIGVRRDPKAVGNLIPLTKNATAEVASVAAVALGRIGNSKATAALRQALVDGPDAIRSAVAEGCILCAEKLLANGHANEATQLYDEVRAADVPKQRMVEATRGAILARGADGIGLLVAQLKSDDPVITSIGLMAARELSGANVTKKLMAALTKVAPDRQALLILAMGDRGDTEAVPALLDTVQNGPTGVRIAALEVLQRLGNVESIPVLLSVAAGSNVEVAAAAKASLKSLPGDGVDAELIARLAHAQGADRLALIELVGLRRLDALPPLLKAVDDTNLEIRTAALIALGEVAKLDNVSILIGRVLHPAHAQDGPVALKALQAACIRMPDREASAEKLATALADAPPSAQGAILETLTAMGGKKALQTLRAAANSDDAQSQDTATRLLGSWMTVDAGPVLLELATASDGPYKVRSLRGYIRLVRQFLMPDAQRAAMCAKAWKAAQRDTERKLVLQVMQRYPSTAMLQMAVEATQISSLKKEATEVALAVAKKTNKQAEVKKMLENAQQ
ncbi:MAG: HEAT repeat domain-containing protein [Pirellulales bacterium]